MSGTTSRENSGKPRSHSPPGIGEVDPKKRRKVRTCVHCRRRKLQCDQAVPACGRCVKGGLATECIYLDDVEPNRASTGAAIDLTRSKEELDSLMSRLEYQERRTKELEEELSSIRRGLPAGSRQTSPKPDPENLPSDDREPHQPAQLEYRILKGKSFKTRFYGPSYPESLIAYIPDLAALSKEIARESPILVKVRQDLRAISTYSVEPKITKLPITRPDLEALLPQRPDVDELVRSYFESYDNIYHIIHRPSFKLEYEQLWTHPAQARPHFIALVLLMIAISRCLRKREPWLYTGKNSMARDVALTSIDVCENWLGLQKQKKVTVTDFQVRFLICLAKAVTGTHFKRGWIEIGTALKHCMAAGLHIDDTALSKPTSILDREMRRRIWSAMAEFELQTAFVRGMASDQLAQQSDSSPPSNIHDDDLSQDTRFLPAQKPLTEFTSTSFQAMAVTTYPIRHTLSRLLNARQDISFNEARDFTEAIERHIREIPQWPDTRASEAARALLHLNLRQCLLVLHNRQLQRESSDCNRNFSRMVLIDAAANILDTHSTLLAKGCHTLQLLCHDHLRAALSVCHVIGTPQSPSSYMLNHSIAVHADRIVSDVVELIAGKVDRLGAGQQQLWIALVAKAFVRAQQDPKQKLSYAQEAVYRMTGSYYRIMACQGSASPDKLQSTLDSADESTRNMGIGGVDIVDDLPAVDLDSLSAWMLDEWTFASHNYPMMGHPH